MTAAPHRAGGRGAMRRYWSQTRRVLGPSARPARGRIVFATLLGVGAMACAIALIATAAWLISRSAQRPRESALALAIAGVQFFALGRGLLRYCERLAGSSYRRALLLVCKRDDVIDDIAAFLLFAFDPISTRLPVSCFRDVLPDYWDRTLCGERAHRPQDYARQDQ